MILLLCLPLAAPVVAEFSDAGEYIVGSRPLGLAAADLNGDGSIDLVTANKGNELAGPFDDDAGLLTDGQPYFYVVEHAAGMELSLSLHTNAQLDTLRVGFNDGDPLSAAVDAVVSELTVDTTGAPADGVTPIRVTVVPCDVNGVPLGSGLRLTLDVAALTPASLAGPIVDHGDGSYTLSFVASTPGSGQLLLAVEGVLLASSPGLDYD